MFKIIKLPSFAAAAMLTIGCPLYAAKSDAASKVIDTATVHKAGAAHKSSDIIGLNVENHNGEGLGQVEDVAVDLTRSSVISIVIGTSGFLTIGSNYIAVPPDQIQVDPNHKVLLMDLTQAKLKKAPTFSSEQWREFYASNGWRETVKFFDGKESMPSNPVYIQRASKVIGMTVKNKSDDKIGSVENLMLDVDNKKIIAVVVSSGGFLGIGDTLSAVPPRAFSVDADRSILQLDTSKEALQQAPHFSKDEWPDFSQPAYIEAMYRAYHLNTPSSYADQSALAKEDTPKTSESDNRGVTAMDQGNDQRDLHITQQIRKAIVENKNLSIAAQNVKIITINGHVTLRGTVRTAEEKHIIGDIAANVASSGNVENQLEIKQEA